MKRKKNKFENINESITNLREKKESVRELLSFPYTNECQSALEVHKGNKAQCSIN